MKMALFPVLLALALAACSNDEAAQVQQVQQAADDGQAERDATAEQIRNSKPLDLKPIGEQKPADQAPKAGEGDQPTQ